MSSVELLGREKSTKILKQKGQKCGTSFIFLVSQREIEREIEKEMGGIWIALRWFDHAPS